VQASCGVGHRIMLASSHELSSTAVTAAVDYCYIRDSGAQQACQTTTQMSRRSKSSTLAMCAALLCLSAEVHPVKGVGYFDIISAYTPLTPPAPRFNSILSRLYSKRSFNAKVSVL
jgi:hypothetical protein